MVSLSNLYSIEPAPKAPPELRDALPPNGPRSLFDVTSRTPLAAANNVGAWAILSGAPTANTTNEGPSSVEANGATRHGQRVGARGLEAEFNAMYHAHFRLVCRALWRLGVRDSDRMDLAQKVFLTAYLKMPTFEGRSSVSTWLWAICRRTALAYRRSRAIRSEISTDPISLQEAIEYRGGAADELDTNRVFAVALLSKLSERQRIVLTLSDAVEMSAAEIAALLDVPLETVRSRLRYARKKCRREVRRLKLVNACPKVESELRNSGP